MKPATRYMTPVTTRPYGTQEQWDRHVRRTSMGRIALRMTKVLLISVLALFGLILVAGTLSFG
jgi:hypothetical protein